MVAKWLVDALSSSPETPVDEIICTIEIDGCLLTMQQLDQTLAETIDILKAQRHKDKLKQLQAVDRIVKSKMVKLPLCQKQ